MGQKVNPNSFRNGIIRGWMSNWCAPDTSFAAHLQEDFRIRQHLAKHIAKGILSKSLIERTLKGITLTLHTSKPGMIIGPNGSKINALTQSLKKVCTSNPQVNIYQIKRPELDAQLIAENIVTQLETRAPYKRVIKQVLNNSRRMNVPGIKIRVSGRLNGAEIARSEEYKHGSIPLHTLRADIDYASTYALLRQGKIGVKVWVFKTHVYGKRDLSLNREVLHKPRPAHKR